MTVFLPGSTIGIVGGGQLGRMLALEARRMDYRSVVLDPDPAAPAGQVADRHIVAPLTDLQAVRQLAELADVATIEWENADVTALRALAELLPVRPGPDVLEVAQDRLKEKRVANRLGLSTAPFHPVESRDTLHEGLGRLGLPAVLKTATGGYDGKGQRVLREMGDADTAFEALGGGVRSLILEGWVDFAIEVSVLCARGTDGGMASFPVVENVHRNGILDVTVAPAPIDAAVAAQATAAGETLAAGLEVVGLLAVELFVDRRGEILVNEIAPRPHNSGHYTWEACTVSQFEQQLRAVCGLPLARPELLRPAAMANLLGEHIGTGRGEPGFVAALAEPGVAIHLYGKAEGRTGRKVGHITALADEPGKARDAALRARRSLTGDRAPLTLDRQAADTPF